jgi:hypothetical protein
LDELTRRSGLLDVSSEEQGTQNAQAARSDEAYRCLDGFHCHINRWLLKLACWLFQTPSDDATQAATRAWYLAQSAETERARALGFIP